MYHLAGGVERAANLVEFYEAVGYVHLVPAYAKYQWNWVQYYNADVYTLILLILVIITMCILTCCKCLYKKCSGLNSKEKNEVTPQKCTYSFNPIYSPSACMTCHTLAYCDRLKCVCAWWYNNIVLFPAM